MPLPQMKIDKIIQTWREQPVNVGHTLIQSGKKGSEMNVFFVCLFFIFIQQLIYFFGCFVLNK